MPVSSALFASLPARRPSPAHHRPHRSGRLRRLHPSSSRLTHTRSDQPTCVIHPVTVTSILVLHATSPSMEGCRCITSSGSSSATHGLLRCCILTTTDHILDFMVDHASVRLACMVFIRLFEFFADSFELRRHVIRIIRPCVRSSGSTSLLRPATPHC
jgi:hypothetical protein